MNKVILIGRLTKDPIEKVSESGKNVCRFTLAVPRQFNREETDFINCVCFGKTAELIMKFFNKGRLIAVSGSIRTGSYTSQDNVKKYTTDVVIDSFDFVDNTKTNTSNEEKFEDYTGFDDDSDMPF